MHSLRRVALRSAASAARATVPKTPARQFAGQFGSVSIVVKHSAVSVSRFFSQTARVASYDGEGSEQVPGERTERPIRDDPPNGIWVRNFVFDVTEDHLKELFGKFGRVVQARVVRDTRGLSRGYGFVFMESEEAGKAACEELSGSFWHGRRIHMEPQNSERTIRRPQRGGRSSREPPAEPTKYLFIGNIPYEATDAELNRMFRALDNLEDVRVAVDRVTGWPRGFAHADFTDVESAKKAVEKLSGFEMGGRYLRVDYTHNAVDNRPRENPLRPRNWQERRNQDQEE